MPLNNLDTARFLLHRHLCLHFGRDDFYKGFRFYIHTGIFYSFSDFFINCFGCCLVLFCNIVKNRNITHFIPPFSHRINNNIFIANILSNGVDNSTILELFYFSLLTVYPLQDIISNVVEVLILKTNNFNGEMGKRIIKRRKQLGLSQEQLAELADVSPQMISTAERGNKSILSENLYKISKALNVSADYLLSGEITESSFSEMYKRVLKTPAEMQEKIFQVIDILLEK